MGRFTIKLSNFHTLGLVCSPASSVLWTQVFKRPFDKASRPKAIPALSQKEEVPGSTGVSRKSQTQHPV